jgi:hypothetical protein
MPMDAVDQCATCDAPMASDQRYCLECGTRRAHVAAAPLGAPPAPSSPLATGSHSAGVAPAAAADVGGWAASPATNIGASAIAAAPARSGGPTAVIAGVGVLLLAMGVGVLIGRAGSSAKTSTAPAQVISVASPGAPVTSTSPTISTPATSTPSTTPKSGSKSGKSKSSSEVGQVPSKPAPPTVVPKAGGSGQSYEQKSKNLPNVVSTG